MNAPAPNSSAIWVATWALVGLLVAVGMAWYWARRWWQIRTELQQCRSQTHALVSLLDVWQWRTDAEHRLVQWRAPFGTPPASPDPTLLRPLLWEFFQASEPPTTSLQVQLSQHSAVHGLAVRRPIGTSVGTPGTAQACLLNAAPLLDNTGRFCGHVGTACDAPASCDTLLSDVLNALPTPVLQVSAPGAGLLPTLTGHNSAAAQWLGSASPYASALPWAEVLQRIPPLQRPAVEHAINHPGAQALAAVDGWALRVHSLQDAPPGQARPLLLVFQRAAAAPSATAFNAQQDDQESFSYTVSHDLRAPIRVVEGFTKIVKEDYGRLLDRVGNDHLDRVLAAASRMNSMIDSLLALSQLSSRPLTRQPVNLSQLAHYILDDLRRQSPEREVQVHIEPGLIAHGDATLLRVVLENLLGNAWKYTGKCRNARLWLESSVHEGRPAFTVRDNGAGFDMRFADRLFGVFQRLHSASDFQGTGVGLASVRRILRRHGGDIWAEGEVDRGARFQFWIQE